VLRKGYVSLANQVERLTEAYLRSVIPLVEYQRRRQELEQKQQALVTQERQLEAQGDWHRALARMVTSMEAFCQRVQAGLANATFEQQRTLVELLVDRVLVVNGEVEIRYFIPTHPRSATTRFCHLRKDYFHMVVQIAVGAVPHPVPENIPNGTWIGLMAICRDAGRRPPCHGPCRPKEGLGRCKVSGITEANIHEVAISIHRSVEVLPLALDTDIGFVHRPAVTDLTVPPLAKRLTEERSELASPLPHGLMGHNEAPMETHPRQIPQTQLIPEALQHRQTDHIGRILPPSEGHAGPLIEAAPARATAQAAVPQLRPIRALGGRA
jgi:hypothetical protein